MKSIRVQLDFLSRFAEQIRSGAQRLDGTLRRRGELYVESARGVFEQTRRTVQRELGNTQERRVLNASAEHCEDCVALADQGWQPIGTLPIIGEGARCRSRCRCRMEFK